MKGGFKAEGYIRSRREICGVSISSSTHPFRHSIPLKSQCHRYTLRMGGIPKTEVDISARTPAYLSRRRQTFPGPILTLHEGRPRQWAGTSNSHIHRRHQKPDLDPTLDEHLAQNIRLSDPTSHSKARPPLAEVVLCRSREALPATTSRARGAELQGTTQSLLMGHNSAISARETCGTWDRVPEVEGGSSIPGSESLCSRRNPGRSLKW